MYIPSYRNCVGKRATTVPMSEEKDTQETVIKAAAMISVIRLLADQ